MCLLGSCVGSGAGAQGGLPRCVVTMLVATLAVDLDPQRFTPVNALVLRGLLLSMPWY